MGKFLRLSLNRDFILLCYCLHFICVLCSHNLFACIFQPISIIAPFTQGNTTQPTFTSSTNSLLFPSKNTAFSPPSTTPRTNNKLIKRNQSFSGFQNNQIITSVPTLFENGNFSRNFSNPYLNYSCSNQQQIRLSQPVNNLNRLQQEQQQFTVRPFMHFSQLSGLNRISSQYPFNLDCKVQSATSLNQINQLSNFNFKSSTNPFSIHPKTCTSSRVVGRRESLNEKVLMNAKETAKTDESKVVKTNTEIMMKKRFNSLEFKKHKCYSPTFYSMRCKKHAKKRPVVYALPKKVVHKLPKTSSCTDLESLKNIDENQDFQSLTDSIQIFEQNSETPVPAPRCKKHQKRDIIYANVSKNIEKARENGIEKGDSQIEITQAQIHAPKDENASNNEEKVVVKEKAEPFSSDKIKLSNSRALKNSPTLKVSPNFIKPKTESPKGALSLQIQAKKKASPIPSTKRNSKDDESGAESIPFVPKMPLIDQSKWIPNVANANWQVCVLILLIRLLSINNKKSICFR